MFKYSYTNILTCPKLGIDDADGILYDGIHFYVEQNEDLNTKNLLYCFWDEFDKELDIFFENELSSLDKEILDQIVQENI